MTDSSDDSADTVISVLDSRPSQSQSTSDSLSAEDSSPAPQTPDDKKLPESNDMGNRHGGEKKKKDDVPQEKKPEDKPKKKGKKSKGKSKRNSQNVEGDLSPGHGACASPSSSTVKEKTRPRSKRPDVLADLGANAPGSPLGSPESASGSQGTWSYDDESDVSTLGYSTPLLSTPQVQRYVLPKQTTPQQSSTERLEELGRSIEKTIIDKLSDKPAEQGATAALPQATNANRKERRNIKKKRALGQAVIDSDSFQLSLQDVKAVQSENRSPQSQRLNAGSEKISLRASQESPVSPWLRDDDTPVDEEQMDEMFISCIDLSYNLADICSEKEFTEYGSLDSKKRAKPETDRAKETSLSPRTARRPVEGNVSPWSKDSQKMQPSDRRDTPPKSDSSTSTLAEVGRDTVQEACELDQPTHPSSTEIKTHKQKDTICKPLSVTTDDTVKEAATKDSSQADTATNNQVKKKTGKSKSMPKSKTKSQKEMVAPIASKESDIPTEPETSEPTDVSCDKVQVKSSECENLQTDMDIKQEQQKIDDTVVQQRVTDKNEDQGLHPETISEPSSQYAVKVMAEASDSVKKVVESDLPPKELSDQSTGDVETTQISKTDKETVSISNEICGLSSKPSDSVPCNIAEQNTAEKESAKDSEQFDKSLKDEVSVPKATESLSPHEPASPKHVPPPSPSAMDALAEIDEDDEEAIEALEENSQLKEVQLFGETVFKRLSSLVESQSQDEDTEERFRDFRDSGDIEPGETDSPPVNLGSMALLNGDASECLKPKCSEVPEVQGEGLGDSPKQIVEEELVAATASSVDKGIVDRSEYVENNSQLSKKGATKERFNDYGEDDIIDDGTLKKKKKKSGQKKNKKEQGKSNEDRHGNIVKKPEIPAELKQVDNTVALSKSKSDDKKDEKRRDNDELEKENTPPKRESQQIGEVIDAYGFGDIVDVSVEQLPSGPMQQSDYLNIRPRYESDDDDEEDDDSDSSCNSRSRSSERPSTSSLDLSSRQIPDIEETFNELLSVKHILEDFEDRTPTEEFLPTFVSSEELRSPPECVNGRRSRMSPAITDRTESDLDISEQRDDISTDSMYADDEDDGASEVLFSRSYSEPAGNEVVVSCTFYNTQHNNNNNNADDSDDFWEDYSTADESFKQIEISADAASSTFQNARKQMHDIHQHLQDLRRQMEYLQEEVESATLTPEYSMDSEEKRPITE